jgi:hypothetical protein
MSNLYNRNKNLDDTTSENKIIKNDLLHEKHELSKLFNTSKKYNKTKGKPRIKEQDFKILKLNEYENIFDFNYSILQLKKICKHFKLKVSGNKSQLQNRLYKHMRETYNIVRIQKLVKGYIVQKYFNLQKFSLKHKNNCVNDCDFLSLEPLNELPYYQVYCFKDNDNFIYGFDLCSLYNLLKNDGKDSKNPYNRKIFPCEIIKNIRELIRMCRVLKFPLYTEIQDDNDNVIDEKIKLEQNIENVFYDIDQLGFYTNTSWFYSLNIFLLKRFLRELRDIWNYRLQIPYSTKLLIYPYVNANPFHSLNDILYINYNLPYETVLFEMRKITYNIINNLVNSTNNDEYRKLGSLYVLTALTLVNKDASEAMPWLYLSAV